jgi:large subunit ribosomal protein L32e
VKNVKTEKRRKLKARIPKIVRQESWRYKRIKENWRRPTGVSNKMRRRQRGWPKSVSIGYKTPNDLRHLHPSGLREMIVHRAADLDKLDPKTYVARIGHTVGEKKRVAILDRARELEINVVNPGVSRREERLGETEPVTKPSESEEEPAQPEAEQQQPQEEKKT